ncbi:hypothetical protein BUALT_Bualt01G0035800 [Buddleja alternifolia]|uniref:Uncharacterized protein n=1 Tax=Buddleja alternifolia TaxID=168488 RepID=A0AAV6YES3_9LAMI|nr:hypothetical protein BUALT_Bualt01G0035800 [Buddleja alternifolia]
MAATRVLRMPRIGQSHEVFINSPISTVVLRPRTLMCLNKNGLSSGNPAGGVERKAVAVKAAGCSSVVSEPKTDKGVDLGMVLRNVCDVMSQWMKLITKKRVWRLNIQMFIEKGIVDCRFFTLLAVGGSLIGSILCFVEGCVLILESYFQYFYAISKMSQQGHIVRLLIEAIDMFLVGTAMLVFGMSLHVMFVGTNNLKVKGSKQRNFNFQKLLGIESVGQAKTKIGHAVIMILQVEVLEKFKSIPMANGLDLACFAGALFMSSASIFLLSRMGVPRAETTR